MSDVAVGIAFLDWSPERPYGYLFFPAKHRNGRHTIEHIPVIGDGAAEPDKKRPYWIFKGDASDVLKMHPSVRIDYGNNYEWHNTYDWQIRHVVASANLYNRAGVSEPEGVVKFLNPGITFHWRPDR